MPPVKTPEERGPAAWWAYSTRDRIDMSVEQVVAELPTPTHTSTLRKAEGDSRNMSRRLLRELGDLYRREYRKRELDYTEPPGGEALRSAPGDIPALVRAISDLVTEMRLARDRDQDAAAAILKAAEALGSLPRPGAIATPRAQRAPHETRE